MLQHLSNYEITLILNKVKYFKYLILTEHIPAHDFIANKDIISGQGIRSKKASGVDILKSPFNLIVEQEDVLSTVHLGGTNGCIVTKLYTFF